MSADTTHQQEQDKSINTPISWSIWLNRISFVFVVVVIPVFYYLKILNKEWINRIGIIFNFLAGFMIAPELIGIQRLAKIEIYTEKLFVSGKTKLDKSYSSITNLLKDSMKEDDHNNNVLFSITSLIAIVAIIAIIYLIWFGYYFYSFLIFASYYFLVYLITICIYSFTTYSKSGISFLNNIKKYFSVEMLIETIVIMLVSIYLPFWYIGVMLIILILVLVQKPVTIILNRLSGDEQLRYILVRWGILFFIIGNLLQFIATF